MTTTKRRRTDTLEVYLDLKDRYGVDTKHGRMWGKPRELTDLKRKYRWVFGRMLEVARVTMVP